MGPCVSDQWSQNRVVIKTIKRKHHRRRHLLKGFQKAEINWKKERKRNNDNNIRSAIEMMLGD